MVLTSGKVVNIKVVDVSRSELRYRVYGQIQGPILAEKLANIYYVQYENGGMQIYNANPARTNNYVPYRPMNNYKPYSREELPSSNLTTQIDLYIQDMWGVGTMLRKEFNQYVGLNIIGGSFMSSWYEYVGPNNFGIINARACGIRLYLPCVDPVRAYVEITPGFTHLYVADQHTNCFGFDFSAGFQIHKNVAIGYNLNYLTNKNGHATTHWGRISFLF